jgi:hypothetical protein
MVPVEFEVRRSWSKVSASLRTESNQTQALLGLGGVGKRVLFFFEREQSKTVASKVFSGDINHKRAERLTRSS